MQPSLFDETDLVEIRSDDFPGERLMVCRNPLLAELRARKREELLRATEELLDAVVAATRRERQPLRGADMIALRVGKVVGKYKMAKHFDLDVGERSFAHARKADAIAAEAALDGIYVVRTSLPDDQLDAASGRRWRNCGERCLIERLDGLREARLAEQREAERNNGRRAVEGMDVREVGLAVITRNVGAARQGWGCPRGERELRGRGQE